MALLTSLKKDNDALDEQKLFWRTVLGTLSSGGSVKPKFKITQYPKDARHQDLVRIGQDMYVSLRAFDKSEIHEES